jgi:uncharacterized protein YggE
MLKIWFALGLWLLATGAAPAQEQRTITVMGQATIDAVPDMATLTIDVTQDAPEAAVALAATSEAVGAVIARLQAEGIAARDMQTSGLSLQPVWSNRASTAEAPPEITGFVARNGVIIRVRDLTALGRILDLSVQDGANGFQGLQFGLQDPAPLLAEARKEAVADAISRAADLAGAAGLTLGPVLSIVEGGGMARPIQMEMASMRASADVPIAAGEVGFSGQVTMVFAIAD